MESVSFRTPRLRRTLEDYCNSLHLGNQNREPNIHFGGYGLNKVWEVTHADIRLDKQKVEDALVITDLRRYKVSGRVYRRYFLRELQGDSGLALEIVQRLLVGHFPSTIFEDILQEAGFRFPLQIDRLDLLSLFPITPPRDPNFRVNILRAYEYKCAVCGFDVRLGDTPVALEAAHIQWHQAGGPDEPINGLALCSLHHKLFDRGAFTLSNQLQILVSDDTHGSVGFQEWLLRFHGTESTFRKDGAIILPKISSAGTLKRCSKGSTVSCNSRSHVDWDFIVTGVS